MTCLGSDVGHGSREPCVNPKGRSSQVEPSGCDQGDSTIAEHDLADIDGQGIGYAAGDKPPERNRRRVGGQPAARVNLPADLHGGRASAGRGATAAAAATTSDTEVSLSPCVHGKRRLEPLRDDDTVHEHHGRAGDHDEPAHPSPLAATPVPHVGVQGGRSLLGASPFLRDDCAEEVRRTAEGAKGAVARRRLRGKTKCTQGEFGQGDWSQAGDECKGVVINTSPKEEESSAPPTRQLKTQKFTSQGRMRATCSTNSAAELVHAKGILPNVSETAAGADYCRENLQ